MPAAAKRGKKTAATESVALNAAAATSVATEPLNTTPSATLNAPLSATLNAPLNAKKSKKPVKVVAVVTPNGIEGSFTPEPRRPLIAHLKVNPIAFSQGTDADAEPEPFNPGEMNMFSTDQADVGATPNHETLNVEPVEVLKAEPVATVAAESTRPLQCFAKIPLMVQFEEASKAKRLPEKTDVACFWCAHTFENQPCILPEREVGGVFIVYGNFCCPECALAYVLHETIDPHVRWERIALLHRIYDREGAGRMFPAPPRDVLKLFGGALSIESFRATIRHGKVRVDMHMPPMVSILGSIDTKPIDFFDSSIKNTMIGSLQIEKTQKAEEGLRLKRTKPLKDKESTLDSVMSIHIKSSQQR